MLFFLRSATYIEEVVMAMRQPGRDETARGRDETIIASLLNELQELVHHAGWHTLSNLRERVIPAPFFVPFKF